MYLSKLIKHKTKIVAFCLVFICLAGSATDVVIDDVLDDVGPLLSTGAALLAITSGIIFSESSLLFDNSANSAFFS